MKTSSKIIAAASVLFISCIILMTACKKDSSSTTPTTANNTAAASNLSANGATSDNAYDDAFNLAVQTGYDKNLDNLMQKRDGGTTLGYNFCATVTASGTSFPVTVTVDFGAGCKSADSITRSGSITYVFSGKLSTPGTTISATFNNYVVNGYGLTGTYAISNTSVSALIPSFTTTVTNGSITYPNDTSYSFSGTKTVVVTSSDNTPSDISSLVFTATGGYSISSSYGESLTATVTTPLERKETCLYVDKGVTSFKYTKGSVSVNGTVDYGDGTCDNSALITIGSFTETVTIP
jgi:hypothetical protein